MKYWYLLLVLFFISCRKSSPGNVGIQSATTNTSITLINNRDTAVNLINWQIEESYGFEVVRRNVYNFAATPLAKGATVTLLANSLGFVLNKNNTLLTLYDDKGNKISELSGAKFK